MEDNVDWRLNQWRTERPDIDPTPMGVVARIQRACRLLERELRANFAAHDLQLWEFDVLGTLRRSGIRISSLRGSWSSRRWSPPERSPIGSTASLPEAW